MRTDLVWHYTNAEGLLSIVRSNTLWATAPSYLNDLREMRTAADVISAYVNSIEDNLSEEQLNFLKNSGMLSTSFNESTFLLSASRDGDSLTMFRNYGGDVAYAIGLDPEVALSPVSQVSGEAHPNPPPGYYEPDVQEVDAGVFENLNDKPDAILVFGGEWRDARYVTGPDDPSVAEIVAKEVSRFEGGKHWWIPSWSLPVSEASYIKHSGFRDEQETRCVVWAIPYWKFVLHRSSRFGLVPYIELTAETQKELPYEERPAKLPIREIVVGPTPVPDEDASRSLAIFLERHGYGDVSITTSKIPYR